MHRARGFFKRRKQALRQWRHLRAFHGVEHLADLLPGGAVNARVGHAAFPIPEEPVLRSQTLEAAALERVFLTVLDAGLDLTLVPGHRRARRQHHRAVMPAKLLYLRVEFGVKPVGPRHGRAQVVNHQRPGHTPEMPKRVFQTADEALGRLSPHHLAIAFARMTQYHPEQVWSLSLTLHHYPGTLAKIHLRFGSRLHFHPYERDRLGLPQLPYKPFDRLITASESVVPTRSDKSAGRSTPPTPLLQSAAAKAGRNFGGHTRRSKWLVLNRNHPPSRG